MLTHYFQAEVLATVTDPTDPRHIFAGFPTGDLANENDLSMF